MKMTGSQVQMLKGLITNPNQPQFQGTFKQGNYWIVTDGFTCLYFKGKPDLPICQGVDTNMFQFIDLPVSVKSKLLPDIKFVAEVKKLSGTNKRKSFPYEIDSTTHVRVNPAFLWRMMKLLPKAQRVFYTTRNKQIVIMDGDDNYGMLMPIRYDENAPYINEQGELINPNLGEEIIKEEDECNSIETVTSV